MRILRDERACEVGRGRQVGSPSSAEHSLQPVSTSVITAVKRRHIMLDDSWRLKETKLDVI